MDISRMYKISADRIGQKVLSATFAQVLSSSVFNCKINFSIIFERANSNLLAIVFYFLASHHFSYFQAAKTNPTLSLPLT